MFSDKIETMHRIINLMDVFDEGDSLLVDTIYGCVKNVHEKCKEHFKEEISRINAANIKKSFKIPNTETIIKSINGVRIKDIGNGSEDEFEIPEDKKIEMDAIIAESTGYDVQDIYLMRKTGDVKTLLELISKADTKSLYESLKNVLSNNQHITDRINKREESLRKDTKSIHVDHDMLYGVMNLINKINHLINDPISNHLYLMDEDLSENYRIGLTKGIYSVDEMVSIIAEHLSDPDLKLEELKDLVVVAHQQKCATLIDLINAVVTITNVGVPAICDIEDLQTPVKISTSINIMVDIDSIPIITTYRVFIEMVNEILKEMLGDNKDKIDRAKALILKAYSILHGDE